MIQVLDKLLFVAMLHSLLYGADRLGAETTKPHLGPASEPVDTQRA